MTFREFPDFTLFEVLENYCNIKKGDVGYGDRGSFVNVSRPTPVIRIVDDFEVKVISEVILTCKFKYTQVVERVIQ